MTLSQALIGFAGIAFLITIIPATDTALVLRSLVARGRTAAFACILGITAGLLIWGVAAATGLAVLMATARASSMPSPWQAVPTSSIWAYVFCSICATGDQ